MPFRFASNEFCTLAENKVTIWGWLFACVAYTKTIIPHSVANVPTGTHSGRTVKGVERLDLQFPTLA